MLLPPTTLLLPLLVAEAAINGLIRAAAVLLMQVCDRGKRSIAWS